MEFKVSGDPIRNYMAENNVSAEEFCKKFDINAYTFNNIVNGKKVKLTTLFVLAHKMDLSLNSFLA